MRCQAKRDDVSCEIDATELFQEMRDGVRLYTVLARPAGSEKCPIVVIRTPYAQTEPDLQSVCDAHLEYFRAGYAIALQHCRGTGCSDGDCIPYINEHNDGLDFLDFLRTLPYYDGAFYLYGGSYLSSVHFSYLREKPSDVKGAFLAVQDDNRYNILYRNGFFKCGLHGSWYAGSMYKKKSLQRNYSVDAWRMLPLSGFCEAVFGENAPLDEELRHPDPQDDFWKTPEGGANYLGALESLEIPVALVTAWHDIYTEGVIQMWRRLPEAQRKRCPLLVTPFAHAWSNPQSSPVAFEGGEVPGDLAINWFEHIRKGTPLGFLPETGVKWYNLFGKRWETGEDLPQGASPLRLFLNDGLALGTAPSAPRPITYTYNPAAPAPFQGGCCNTFGGMQVQDKPNSRYDILSFLTEPFEQATQVRGQSEIELRVRSDCPDTCFYARLSFVRDDVAYCLRDDICSISQFAPEYAPGQEITVKMHFAESVFLLGPGDRLRLDISSSAWPHYVPHTNRRGRFAEQTGADVARNTILTGLSSLTLHVD